MVEQSSSYWGQGMLSYISFSSSPCYGASHEDDDYKDHLAVKTLLLPHVTYLQ